MYVVTVDFRIKAEFISAFRTQMIANATASRDKEPGCLQFDVCTDPAAGECIYLYEVYTDRAAFDAHVASAHFKTFDSAVAQWVAGKTVRIFERIDPH